VALVVFAVPIALVGVGVLKQRYLDPLAERTRWGDAVVVPEGCNGIVNPR
jgi:hypothetical protein